VKISANGLALIKHFEGCKIKAYKCPAGIWTIGYGSTGSHVTEGKFITQQEAENLLLDDLHRFEIGVDGLGLSLSQCKFDALVSFAFNLGLNSLKNSTLLKKIRAGKPDSEVALEFLKWNKAGGQVLQGLVKRRKAESELFLGGDINEILS